MDLTEFLQCPSCGSALEQDRDVFICKGCGLKAPVVRNIVRFVGSEAYTVSFGYQWGKFRTTQLDRAPEDESAVTFREKTGIDLSDLQGKRVLDVGCGMGRFAEVCARSGAQVIAVDLSSAVEPAAENLREFPNCRVVQADIFDLPFREESFDVIYSIGVLHHTPDTKEAFLRLPRLLAPGGQLAIWVYSAERQDLYASGLKYTFRRITPKLNHQLLLKISRIAVPLYSIHKTPVIGFVTRKIIPTSMHPDPEWRILDTFDDYSPRYRWRHTYDEVLSWFAQAKMIEIESLEPRVAVRGRKP